MPLIIQTSSVIARLVVVLMTVAIFVSCRNDRNTPFPSEDIYAQPVAEPIQFGAEQSLRWPETGKALTSSPAQFDYRHLPEANFDSSLFVPFSEPPQQISFDFNALPEASFNFDSLPEIPLRYRTSELPTPEITRVSRPTLKSTRPEVIFDFGNQLNGVRITFVFKGKNGLTWITTSDALYKFDGESLSAYRIDGFKGSVSYIREDADNKMWISTRSGIFVVDFVNGVSMKLSKQTGLPNHFAIGMQIDRQNRVWACLFPSDFDLAKTTITDGCLAIIDQSAKKIKLIRMEQGLSGNSPAGVAEDSSGNMWVALGQAGMNIINPKTNRIRYMRQAQGIISDTLLGVNIDRSGNVWVSEVFGDINRIDVKNNRITKFDKRQGMERFVTFDATPDSRGDVWISTEKGLKVIDRQLTGFRKLDRSSGLNSESESSVEDAAGQILIATRSGLNILSKNRNTIRRVGNAQISTLLEDSHGRIWIGTLDKGIQILDTTTGKIRLYDRQHGLSDDLIQFMVEYDGNIFLSTQAGGIEIIDTSLKKIERIGVAQGLNINLITIAKDKNSEVWLGGINKGLMILDQKNKQIKKVAEAEGLRDSAIIDIKRDSKDRMWTYSWTNGVGLIDVDKRTVKHIEQSTYKSLTGNQEDNILMPDSKGNVWVLTSVNGVFMINPNSDSVTHFTRENGLMSDAATSIGEYDGRIYVGTSLGLTILTPPDRTTNKQWQAENLGKTDGILKVAGSYKSDMITSNGQYWWGDDGVTIISNLKNRNSDTTIPATAITGFDIHNQQQNFISDPWKNRGDNDTIWNADGRNGGFYAGRKSRSQMLAKSKNDMGWDSLSPLYQLPVNLQLRHNQNYLQFHFAQIYVGIQDTVWYKYILEGIDPKWSEKTARISSENYPGVAPGHYTFKVASYYKGKWGTPAEFAFTILPPWWKTWWAYLLYTIFAAAILRSYIVFRSRRLLRENKVLEEKVELRTNQLQQSIEELKATQSQLIQSEKMASLGELTAGIAHEIQNPLNFINNFSDINRELVADMKAEMDAGDINSAKQLADDILSNEEKINHHGRRADSIVKSMLQHSRNNQHAIKESTDINKLADEYLRLAYHGLRAKDKSFNATLNTNFDPSIDNISIVANDIGRVLLNLITNAFYAVGEKKRQHPSGYAPAVTVTTKNLDKNIEITVEDNADGIPSTVLEKIFQPFFTTKPTGQGTGLGLSLAYDIVKAHGGSLSVKTSEGTGAVFTIRLPIIYNP